MKLHLCCGPVYLEGFVNIDIQGITILEYPYSIKKATLENYYNHKLKSPPKSRRGYFPIDYKWDLLIHWPWEDDSINSVVMIQGIEHFLEDEAEFILSETNRILKSGGTFIFDFPDVVKTVEEYKDKDFEFMNRLIYCNHKDRYSVHRCCYSEKTFSDLLYKSGTWKNIEYKPVVKHDYPTIGGIAIK